MLERRKPIAMWFGLAALIAFGDQASKSAIQAALQPGERVYLAPFFDLVLAFNKGAAFSFLADQAGWQRVFFIAIASGASMFIAYLLHKHRGETLFCAGLALILGGALGNLYDRVAQGHVVDFLLLHAYGFHWPAFNLADSSITVGAGVLVADSIRTMRRARAAEARS